MEPILYRKSWVNVTWTIATAVVYILVFGVVWCHFSGWVNYDASLQWAQVQTGRYDNWHPFAHTIAFMGLPSLLWNDYRVVILSQIAIFSVAMGYLAKTLVLCGVSKILHRIIMAFLILHPLTIFFIQTMPKDSAFAIFVLLSLSAVLRIVFSHGEELREWPTVIVLSSSLAFVCLVRHNGIFFAVPLLLALVWKYYSKEKLAVTKCIAGIFAIVMLFKVLLPCLFDVRPASQHSKQYLFIESAGVPLSMMGAVYVNHPDSVPSEAATLLESIRPREIWLEQYKLGSFNLVKHAGVAKLPENTISGIDFKGWIPFVKVFYETFRVDPQSAIAAFVALTEQVWDPFAFREEDLTFPMVKIGVWKYRNVILPIARFIHIPVLGFIPFVVLSLLCLSLRAVVLKKYTALVFYGPLLCYDFGTMMLLSGFNMQRLFFCNILAGLPVIWSMFKYEQQDNNFA